MVWRVIKWWIDSFISWSPLETIKVRFGSDPVRLATKFRSNLDLHLMMESLLESDINSLRSVYWTSCQKFVKEALKIWTPAMLRFPEPSRTFLCCCWNDFGCEWNGGGRLAFKYQRPFWSQGWVGGAKIGQDRWQEGQKDQNRRKDSTSRLKRIKTWNKNVCESLVRLWFSPSENLYADRSVVHFGPFMIYPFSFNNETMIKKLQMRTY